MRWLRQLFIALRLAGPYWYAPWRSPLLRWRAETYGCTDAKGHLISAQHMTPQQFRHFCWTRRRELRRFLRWAERLSR